MFRDLDPVIATQEQFQSVSIAGRGFYALEFLLYDPLYLETSEAAYRCAMINATTKDIAANAKAILVGWSEGYADLMRQAGSNSTYQSEAEAAQQMFTALSAGLEFTSMTRLGRPMGTFDRPRPNRAEVRRSERSLDHVVVSLKALQNLAALLSDQDEVLDATFLKAIMIARDLDDPIFAGVSDVQGRLRVEILQQSIDTIRLLVANELGPRLGIAAGFNSQDGD